MPTRSALTLETKDSFISLLTNLNDKNNMAAIPLYSSIMSVAWLSSDLFRGSRGFKPPAFLTLHSWLPPLLFLPPSFSLFSNATYLSTLLLRRGSRWIKRKRAGDDGKREKAGALSPSHGAPRALFFFVPCLPTTERGLCGEESLSTVAEFPPISPVS